MENVFFADITLKNTTGAYQFIIIAEGDEEYIDITTEEGWMRIEQLNQQQEHQHLIMMQWHYMCQQELPATIQLLGLHQLFSNNP